jgi:type IX secretion system PorP/SprF family membrane protein
MKRISLLFCISHLATYAQQTSLLTLFWNNYSLVNPAMTGADQKHRATVNWRNQWDKVNGAPNTLLAGYQVKHETWNSGFGINYTFETIGFERSHQADLNYSYHIELSRGGKILLGASAGYRQSRHQHPFNPGNSLFPVDSRNICFVANVGLAYSKERFLVGVSSTSINQPRSGSYQLKRVLHTHASYAFSVGKKLEVKPQVLFRTDLINYSMDLNLLATFKKQYWIGISYRHSDAICGMLGVDLKQKYRVSYAYDYTINKLSSISRGSHEIGLALLLE